MEQPHKTISAVSNIRLSAGWHSPLLFRPVSFFFFIFKEMGQALAQQTCTCNALTMQHWLLHIQCCMTNRKVKIDITQYYFDTSIICWCMDNLNETQKKWIDYALQLQFAFTVCPCKLTYMQLIEKRILADGIISMSFPLCFDIYQTGWEGAGIVKHIQISPSIWDNWHFNFRRQRKSVADTEAASVSVLLIQFFECVSVLI